MISKASLRQAGAVLRLIDEAGWESDLVQAFLANWGGIRDITVALREGRLTPEQLKAVVEGRFEIVTAEEDETVTTDYVVPLSDADAIAALVFRGRSEQIAETMVGNWRSLATSLNYSGPVCWQVKAGFTLKRHAPKAGPCYNGFQHLQNWDFPDEPTKDQLVFWIPRLLEGSTKKSVEEQMALIASARQQFKLPGHHLTSYGQASLLSGLILAHHKATGEQVPLNQLWTRTDTRRADGRRLDLGHFGGDGLGCDDWGWDGRRNVGLGCFPLGVEP